MPSSGGSEPLKYAVEKLRRKFPRKSWSWIRRALLRLGDVREVAGAPAPLYVVYGRRELGDYKPAYQVWWSDAEGRWYCTCYFSRYGAHRRKEICTHVAAVLLYREYRKLVEEVEDEPVYVAEAEVLCPEEPRGGEGVVEVKAKLAEEEAERLKQDGLLRYARPAEPLRWRVLAVSRLEEVEVLCRGRSAARVRGEEMTYKAARVLAEEWAK